MVCLVFGPFLDFLDGFGPFRVRVGPFAIIRKPPLLTRRDGSIRAIRRPPRYFLILTSHILLSPFSVFYDSRILRFRECWLFEFLVKALKDTTPGRCRRLRRLPIPHRRLIQEQHFQNPKLSKSRSLAATTGRATVQARGGRGLRPQLYMFRVECLVVC